MAAGDAAAAPPVRRHAVPDHLPRRRGALVELGVEPEDISVVYSGVEADAFHAGPRSPKPTLLYLGRLKRYKRLEILLDVLEGVPGAQLHVAGEGDHREAFEAEIAARGLGDRVTLHGFVDEATKRDLLASAWVSLTASSAEGWCLTVMEAGACRTPSAALRVGGLAESIVDGETGVLADEPPELVARVRELIEDPAERERMGAAAERRARAFTWERTAAQALDVLDGRTRRGCGPCCGRWAAARPASPPRRWPPTRSRSSSRWCSPARSASRATATWPRSRRRS